MDGYVRVSDVAGRSGPSYRSPADQEKAIRDWAKRNGVEVGWVPVDENDAWPSLRPVEKRRLRGAMLDRVVVRKAKSSREPLADRLQVVWKGNVLVEPKRTRRKEKQHA